MSNPAISFTDLEDLPHSATCTPALHMAEETEVEIVSRLAAVDIRDLYPSLAAEDATSRLCLLCSAKLKDKTHNLTRHLERHHAGALLQLLEQRSQASPGALASRTRRVQQERSARQASNMATFSSEDVLLQVGDAKLALARWLAQEQLPVDLVEKAGFVGFVESLNGGFSPPKGDELRLLLGTLADDDVDMMALRATCRCREDTPLVEYSRVACGVVEPGEAKVKVLRAVASLFDARTCRGKVLGKDGVLGRAFVGVVSELGASQAEHVKLHDRVVASPYLSQAPLGRRVLQGQEQQDQEETHAETVLQSSRSTSCMGVNASTGALAEAIVLPVENLCVVPPAVPDDLALLSDDVAVVLAVATELQRRPVTSIAILADGPAAILSNLLTRYLHQDLQLAPETLHVFATSAHAQSPHASFTPLDIYQPAAVGSLLARQTELALGAVVDLIGSEASAELAMSLVQSMGCVVLMDRSRLELQLQPPSTVAMDMNAVVVRELEVVSVHDARSFLDDALQYLAAQAQDPQSEMELRERLTPSLNLRQALQKLQTVPEETLEARYLQVSLSDRNGQ
jgi:threonine dehydrogenase-like Zn-dependent dehydrogenase